MLVACCRGSPVHKIINRLLNLHSNTNYGVQVQRGDNNDHQVAQVHRGEIRERENSLQVSDICNKMTAQVPRGRERRLQVQGLDTSNIQVAGFGAMVISQVAGAETGHSRKTGRRFQRDRCHK